MLSTAAVTDKLRDQFPNAVIEVEALDGKADHLFVRVVSELFAGKTLIEQHQMVNAIFLEQFRTEEMHALMIKTAQP